MAQKNKYDDQEYHYYPRSTQIRSKDSVGISGVGSGGVTPENEALYYDALAAADYAQNPYDKKYLSDKYYEQLWGKYDKPDTTPVYYGSGGGGTQTTTETPAYMQTGGAAVPEFSYESAPEYVSRYQSLIDEYLNGVLNRPAFSYNPETDPQYAAYRKQYAREGQRAAADTLGQYAAMTGGMPSTAAVTASQQAGDYYAAQMADKIPELYQAAYAMYQDDYNRQMQNLSMLRALEGDDYGRYADRLGQYNTDRSFAYGLNRDAVSDARYADELLWDRAAAAATIGDYSGYKSLGVNTSLAEAKARGSGSGGGISKSDARSRIEAYLTMGGSVSDLPTDLLAAAGYSDAELGVMGDYYAGLLGDVGYSGIDTDEALKLLKSGNTDIINSPKLQNWLKNYLGITPETTAAPTTPKKDPNATPTAALAPGVYTGGNASLDFNPDEGTFTWNGRVYTPSAFANAVDNASLTDEEKAALTKKLQMYGFDITIN